MTKEKAKKNEKYPVLKTFLDGQDNGKRYVEGETYPKPVNKKVSKERIKELQEKGGIGEKI